MDQEERLSKFLEHSGIASRRKAEDIIRSGRVTVNGEIAREPQFRVVAGRDAVKLDGRPVRAVGDRVYIALNKPVRVLSDLAVNDDRRIARSLIKTGTYLFPVGRLDYQSEGLMFFTNDGEFAHRVMHPRYEIEKEYLVKFKGILTADEMNCMTKGVFIDGSVYKVSSVTAVGDSAKNCRYRVVLHEGKNRMIRKIGERIRHPVLRLKRVRIGNVKLGALKPGEYRFLSGQEIRDFR